ncbi:unnamed protein product [Strongylus vulgaris]|uniref:Uncharacterized protein n=1 Tax=Strongylus vulgaris TaxID=40348 RepID=A0A3P7IG73_STRVU|nr:unnamed protein product [Strongylus vulgaris]
MEMVDPLLEVTEVVLHLDPLPGLDPLLDLNPLPLHQAATEAVWHPDPDLLLAAMEVA